MIFHCLVFINNTSRKINSNESVKQIKPKLNFNQKNYYIASVECLDRIGKTKVEIP